MTNGSRYADTFTFDYRASNTEALRETFKEYGDRLDEYTAFRYFWAGHTLYLTLTPEDVKKWAKKNGVMA